MRLTITFVDFIITMVVLFALQISITQREPMHAAPGWSVVTIEDKLFLVAEIKSRPFFIKGFNGVAKPETVSRCRGADGSVKDWRGSETISYSDDEEIRKANEVDKDVVIGTGIDDLGRAWSFGVRNRTSSRVDFLIALSDEEQDTPMFQINTPEMISIAAFSLETRNGKLIATLFERAKSSEDFRRSRTVLPMQLGQHFQVEAVFCGSNDKPMALVRFRP